MEKKRIITGKPLKMFVYLPVCLAVKKNTEPVLQRIVIQGRIQYIPGIKAGDSFAMMKRDNPADFLNDEGEHKVTQVKYGFMDGSCVVVLEPMTFDSQENMNEFLKNKHSVNAKS